MVCHLLATFEAKAREEAGAIVGQTVMHCHVHLIPRRKGDNPNPRGGVRGVIPGKADYRIDESR